MINHADLMVALTADYLNVFIARPKQDSAEIIKLKGYVTTGINENPQGFQYSKLLSTYANERIYDEDKKPFLNALLPDALIKTFSDGRESIEYNYRIVENGNIHHYAARYSRISNPDEDLRLVVAFRNIDFITNIEHEKRTEGLNSAYNAISSIFFSLHRINIQKNTFFEIKSTNTIKKLCLPDSNDYDLNITRVFNSFSSKRSLDRVLDFIDRSTLQKRMSGKKHITLDFVSHLSEMCRIHFFKEDEDESGNIVHVILGVEKINQEKYKSVIGALSRDYYNVFLIDLKEGVSRILKSGPIIQDGIEENEIYDYQQLCDLRISLNVHPEDCELFKKNISIDNLREVFKDKDEMSGSFRIIRDNEVHHYRYTYIKIANFDSVVAGYQNVDNIIARHIEEEKQQREQELAFQKAREEQLAIFNTLAHNFKNVYLVDINKATAKVLKLEDEYVDKRLDNVMDKEFPYEPFLNAWISESVYPDDKEALSKALSVNNLRQVMAKQEEYIGNYRMLINGKIVNYQFSVNLMQDRIHLIAGFQNVDVIIREHLEEERIRREKEQAYQNQLKEQLATFNILARNFKNVYYVDLEKKTMKVLKLSDGYDESLNIGNEIILPYAEARNHWLTELVYAEDRPELERIFATENVKKLLSEQSEVTGNYRSIIDGKLHHFQYSLCRVDDSGLRAILSYQNVDDIVNEHLLREKKERELEEAKLKNEREHAEVISALSTIYSTIFRANIDTHHYEVLSTIPHMNNVAGVSGNFDDVKQMILKEFMAPEMVAPMSKFLDINTLADRLKDVNTISTEYKNPNNKWYQSRFIVKNRDENGVAKEVLYVAREITNEKNREFEQQEQLSHALAMAQQASKAKSTFLNSMSHDIRTPMNAIIGFTALAQTHMDDKEQVKDYLTKISTSSNHLLSLINDILDMSRIESGTVKLDEKPIHLPDLLHDLRTMIQGLVNAKNQNLYIDTQDVEHEDIIADKLRMNQIMINIVANAVKYTRPGGDIIIRLIEKPCSIMGYRTYEFSVKDNGIGMSKEFLSHIFESFSRERSATVTGVQGTGLGMAITKNIVDMMGGTIVAESEVGKGSKFTVTLNLKTIGETVKSKPIPALTGARALVVDDDLNTCRSVSKMLREIEMRPDWTSSGKEAIVRAQDAADIKDEYKVYIIDYLMPDMNGIEVVRRIRKVISEDVPIIVLTAYDWADLEQEAREAGVTAFVSKPLFMSELRDVLTSQDHKENNVENNEKQYDYSGKHVLLVEDNELNREIAETILENMGVEVDCATDGTEAVDIMYNAADDKYDLIFMDIQMPKMDGYTATHEIRTLANNRKANIPIVAMTANAFEEDKRMSLEAGMNGHISKPISTEDIARVLDLVFKDNK